MPFVRAISLRFVFRSRNSPPLRLHAVYMGHWSSTYSANPTKKKLNTIPKLSDTCLQRKLFVTRNVDNSQKRKSDFFTHEIFINVFSVYGSIKLHICYKFIYKAYFIFIIIIICLFLNFFFTFRCFSTLPIFFQTISP